MSDPYTTNNPEIESEVGPPPERAPITEIEPTDSEALFVEDDSNSLWPDYQIRNRYEKDLHRYMMGLTSPTGFKGNCVGFVQLAAPTLLWICEWTCCRFGGDQPVIPNPDPGNTNWILLDQYIEPYMIAVGPDGVSPLYRVSGYFVYGYTCPDGEIVNYTVYPRPPWLEDVFTRTMSTVIYRDNLSTAQGTQGSSFRTGGPGSLSVGKQ